MMRFRSRCDPWPAGPCRLAAWPDATSGSGAGLHWSDLLAMTAQIAKVALEARWGELNAGLIPKSDGADHFIGMEASTMGVASHEPGADPMFRLSPPL